MSFQCDPWRKMLDLCSLGGVDPQIVVRPHEHKNGVASKLRARIVHQMSDSKLTPKQISKVCGITSHGVRKILKSSYVCPASFLPK